MSEEVITVETVVKAPLIAVWEYWSKPEHIRHWAFASDDWEAPEAENDLRKGGSFKTRMQAKDGTDGFDFSGTYTDVILHERIAYDLDDGRHVEVEFVEGEDGVQIFQTFDPESENPPDMQRQGWQAILDNFKRYAENHR